MMTQRAWWTVLFVILVSCAGVGIETLQYDDNDEAAGEAVGLRARLRLVCMVVDLVSAAVFLAEYAAQLYACTVDLRLPQEMSEMCSCCCDGFCCRCFGEVKWKARLVYAL